MQQWSDSTMKEAKLDFWHFFRIIKFLIRTHNISISPRKCNLNMSSCETAHSNNSKCQFVVEIAWN